MTHFREVRALLPWLLFTKLLQTLKQLTLLVSYVSSNSFPHPLSPEEETRCLELMEQGDEDAKNKLITHNLRLVAHVVKKFENTKDDIDDLISLGTIGLIKGIETFDRSKGTRLATYAARCIENEILMHLRATKRERKDVYLREPIGVDKEGNEITLMDIIPDLEQPDVPESVALNLEAAKLLKCLNCLTQRERKVIILRFGLYGKKRHTQREVAKILGISRSYVSRIEKRAIGKLYQAMSE